MRKWLVAGIGILALAAGARTAAAADLPGGAPADRPAQTVMLFSWSGFYLGAHAGGGWGQKNQTGVPFQLGAVAIVPQSVGLDVRGALAGGQIGYNYQTGIWVLGAEAQASWANLEGDGACPSTASGAVPILSADCSATVNALGTFALRLGVALDRILLYGKGGGAWTNDKYATTPSNAVLPSIFNANETRWGWMAGAGIEFAFTDNWSAKIEYNYMDLGKRSIRFTDAQDSVFFLVDIRQIVNVVKFGVNYRFGVSSVAVRY
jgi:outer membrane immunogenic protein